jgi:hypothetical protein
MVQRKRAQLTGNLVAKKGEAAPAAGGRTETPAAVESGAKAKAPLPGAYYKALTVKLDRPRYEALKSLGIKLDLKSQEIFVEALDAYLAAKSRR